MNTEVNYPRNGQGLPPVTPPTARFVVQLFMVPALIVCLLVAVAYGYHFFFGLLFGSPNPDQFLHKLDDANSEVRWRTAADLAQVLLRDEHLASDPDFGLKLADRLQKAHAQNKDAEKTFADRISGLSAEDIKRERKKLEGERNYIQYLSACLGNFLVPVGVPALKELASQTTDMEPWALALQRRQALWSLAVLGEKCSRFDTLQAGEQSRIIAQLDQDIDRRDHVVWAQDALDYVKARQAGQSITLGVDTTLEQCAEAQEPFIRELAAFALNFWSGTAEQNQRIEKTLEKLSYDKGEGEDEQNRLASEDPDGPIDNGGTTAVTKKPGRKVCYNATIALARRGSDKTRVDLLEEMLDEEQLRDVFRLRNQTGQEQPDEAAVVETVLNTLRAVAKLRRRNPQLLTSSLREAVHKLTSNKNPAIATEAKQTQLALDSAT